MTCRRIVATVVVGLSIVLWGLAPTQADEAPIFDWLVRNASEGGINAIPHAGHDTLALHPKYTELWTLQSATGDYTGLMLQNDTGPYDGTKDPNALATILDWFSSEGLRLDYVFADVETTTTYENTVAMVNLVRGHADPLVNRARVAQYAYYPGTTDMSIQWPHVVDRTDKHQAYLSSGVDIANPNCYPYSYFTVHTRAYNWGDNVAPNDRSALFWAPLERYSVARRNLPEGHQIIPWLAGYIAFTGYDSDQPTAADMDYLLRHMRLRGTDGYYTLRSDADVYTREQYRAAMNVVWHSMDEHFNRPGEGEVIELATHKVEGIQWSGYRQGNRVLVALSNLGTAAQSVDIPDYDGLPEGSPVLGADRHVTMHYLLDRRGDEYFDDRPLGTPLTEQGFNGSSPGHFRLTTPTASGNTSTTALGLAIDSGISNTWWETGTPAFEAGDTVVYSAWMIGTGNVGFGPVAVDDTVRSVNDDTDVATDRQGPFVQARSGKLRVRRTAVAGNPWQSTNLDLAPDHWYEVQLVCTPGTDDATGMVWVRDVTAGEVDYTQVVFDLVTTGTVESETVVPLAFTERANPGTFNGWQVYFDDTSQQVDNLWATLYTYEDTAEGGSHLFASPGTFVPVPEPGTLVLLGGAALVLLRRRR